MTEHYLVLLVGFFLGVVATIDVIGVYIIFKERKHGRDSKENSGS